MPHINWAITAPLIVAVITAIVGYYQGWLESPRRREERAAAAAAAARNAAVADAILGEAPVFDLSGAEIQPERPGLVARTTTLEKAVATLVDQNERIKKLEAGQAEHDAAIAAILAGSYLAGSLAQERAAHEVVREEDK